MRIWLVVACPLAAFVAETQAQTWDLAHDFSLASNPNGPWSYGARDSSGLTLCTDSRTMLWSTGLFLGWTFGDVPCVLLNAGSAQNFGIAAGHASLECDYLTPDARWTAPFDGAYHITLLIGSTDIDGPDGGGDRHVAGAHLEINGALQAADSFVDNVKTWNRDVFLEQGDIVDAWVAEAFQYGNTDTTFTITAIPDPTTLSALALIATPLVLRRRRGNPPGVA
jgi:hypothetical protein